MAAFNSAAVFGVFRDSRASPAAFTSAGCFSFGACAIFAADLTGSWPASTAAIVSGYMKGIDTQVIAEALRYLNFDPRISKQTIGAAQQGLEFTKSTGKLEGDYALAQHLDSKLMASAVSAHPGRRA